MNVICVTNHKGGTGKTTTVINLSAFLAEKGRRVLAIDLDPQGHLGLGLGIKTEVLEKTTYNIIVDPDTKIQDFTVQVKENLDVIPSNLELAIAELDLATMFNRESRVKRKLSALIDLYDYCIIDTPPSLGLLTVNGIVAANSIYIPIQMGYFSLHGVARLAETIEELDKEFGLNLRVIAFATMYEKVTRVSRDVLAEVKNLFAGNIFNTIIRKNTTLNEASASGKPITDYDRTSTGYQDYLSLTEEVLAIEEGEKKRNPIGF